MIRDIPFYPVQGSENTIVNAALAPGSLYFATDSGKIFLDTLDERIALGAAGAAVYYTTAQNLEINPDDSYTIFLDAFDDENAIPKPNDLIINKDGKFFRVISFNHLSQSPYVSCSLIAVSGTGGGGGSIGPSQPDDPKGIEVTFIDTALSFLYGAEYNIAIKAVSKIDKSLNVHYNVKNNANKSVGVGDITITSGDIVKLPVGQYILPEGGFHKVEITITGVSSTPYSWTITQIRCINLSAALNTDRFTVADIQDSNFIFPLIISCPANSYLQYTIDGTEQEPILLNKDYVKENRDIAIQCSEKLQSGVHTIRAQVISSGVTSDPVVCDFIYHAPGAADDVYVIITEYPEKVLSYETPEIKYWVWDTSKDNESLNTVYRSINGVTEKVEQKQIRGQVLSWPINNLEPDQENTCEISCGEDSSRSVKIFCERSAIFDPTPNAIISLSAAGRTNDVSLENRQQWSYTNYKNDLYSANLLNFNWFNNGWKPDAFGNTCLRISNGASVEIPLKLFWDNDNPSVGGFTFEFEFNPYNLYSYHLLTTETITEDKSDEFDDKVNIQRTFDTSKAIITYLASNDDDCGLACGTQDAFFRTSGGEHATARYSNDNIVNVTMVVDAKNRYLQIYINGVMSGMSAYGTDSTLPGLAEKIIINSDQCDIDLYTIRVYNKPLSSSEVVQNYMANKKDLNLYKQNSFSSGTEVSLADLEVYNAQNPSNTTIPYIIFKTKSSPDVLPFNKANEDINCDITFVNPALDHALEMGEVTAEQQNGKKYYKDYAPSFFATNVPINVQGTSSQKYPRKNFKGKFKKASTWKCTNEKIPETQRDLSKFSIRPGMAEKTFTWKADYMDSSSCHNTGFASYVYELYNKHPLDYYESNKDYHSKYRTSLYGFPVLAFHETSEGVVKFIGIYNFNLDKGADDTLGMALETKHPFVDGTFEEEQDDKTIVRKPLDYAHICECWEMANNKGGRCSFRGLPFDNKYDYVKKKFFGVDDNGQTIETTSDIGDDIEVRYHINGDAIEGAWENRTLPSDDPKSEPISAEEAFNILLGGDSDGNNRTGAYKNLERFYQWIQSCYYAFDMSNSVDYELVCDLLGREPQKQEDSYQDNNGIFYDTELQELVDARRAKFENEFDKHLNYEYCMVYYIMTELLLQYDSRGKNMMFASWGPQEKDGEYIWFPIFYDIDTQLGVNNSGIPSWEYNVEPTTGFNNNNVKAFSTPDSLLWNNFHQSYVAKNPTQVQSAYRALRGKSLTIDKLMGYYDAKYEITGDYCMKGILPINVFNANQQYKYIDPSKEGYVIEIKNNNPVFRQTSAYFYCLQGTRELHRDQFLRNRFNYYDSKWMAGSYNPKATGGTDSFWRINYNSATANTPLATKPELKIKPVLDQYIVVFVDEDMPTPIFATAGETATINLESVLGGEYSQQIVHIGGPDYLQEYGNVSLLYTDEFDYSGRNLTKIEMGNESDDYQALSTFNHANHMVGATAEKPLLKVYDITNISSANLTTVNLSDSVKLETFKAIGTQLVDATFADGVNLKTLQLPNTIEKIKLSNASQLNKIVYNKDLIKDNDKNDLPVMYIDNVIHPETGDTNINEINITGGGLKQYSYELLIKLVNAIKEKDGKRLAINMSDVHWTPYRQLGEGAEFNSLKTYYYATDNFSYQKYNNGAYEKASWEQDILNGRIYELEPIDENLSDEAQATTLSLLDTFMEDNKVHFVNVTNSQVKNYPTLSGELYIENIASEPISEAQIANVYNDKFPNLRIRAKYIDDAYRIRFVANINGVEEEIASQRFAKDATQIVINVPQNNIPVPSHKVFSHWSLNGNPITETAIKALVFNNDNQEYIIHAEYKNTSYDIIFSDPHNSGYKIAFDINYNNNLPIPAKDPNLEDNSLDFWNEFYGWTQKISDSGIVNSLEEAQKKAMLGSEIEKLKADRNYNFYPVYIQKGVKEPLSQTSHFHFTKTTINDKEGYIISLRKDRSGKITIPAKHNNLPVLEIGDFTRRGESSLTHIFFEEGSEISSVSSKAFAENSSVVGVYFPGDSLTQIGNQAFQKAFNLKMISDKGVGEISDNITTIGANAFDGGNSSQSMSLILNKLPAKLTFLGESAFYACEKVSFDSIPIGVTTLPMNVFAFCSNLKIVSIAETVTTIGQGAFYSYNPQHEFVYVYGKNRKKESFGESAFHNYTTKLYVENKDLAETPNLQESLGVEQVEHFN